MYAILKVLTAVCFGMTAVAAAAQTDGGVPSGAARRWSLDDCMRYAVENSPRVVRQRLANDSYRQDYSEALASLFPQVSGSVYATMSYGRSIDPATNTYTDNRNLDNNYELSAQMPVFAGLSGINTVRAARVARLLGAEEARQAADEVALETMRAYFEPYITLRPRRLHPTSWSRAAVCSPAAVAWRSSVFRARRTWRSSRRRWLRTTIC